MNKICKWIPGALVAVGALASPVAAPAQQTSSGALFVYGRCHVEAQGWRDNFGQCRLTGTDDGVVPAGMTLVIEHVAASCRGPVEHQITLLTLDTQLEPREDMQTQMVIPLSRTELVTEHGNNYQASFATRFYAGPGTKIEPYLGLEIGFLPTDGASCGVQFHGRFLPAQPRDSWSQEGSDYPRR